MQILTPDWPECGRVRAAFTLRNGGYSAAPYGELNLAAHVGDAPDVVSANRGLLRTHLSLPSEPIWLSQVHGTRVANLDAEAQPAAADAALTRSPGRVCAVLVADCLPVLLATRRGDAVAVAHAGWRGLAAGVLEATLAALQCPADALQAWLGPAISAAHFEVGAEVREAFVSQDTHATHAFALNARSRWQCDLYQLARARLRRLGVQHIHGAVRCTFAQPTEYFSYRRDGVTGRMAALIWLS